MNTEWIDKLDEIAEQMQSAALSHCTAPRFCGLCQLLKCEGQAMEARARYFRERLLDEGMIGMRVENGGCP